MNPRAAIGHVARRLPRGRGHVGQWLHEHPGKGELTFRDINGHRRSANLRDNLEARWFAGERDIGMPPEAIAEVRVGATVIDAGANIGIVTGQLAEAVGEGGTVHAFEPLPVNVDRLVRLREDNGLTQIVVHDQALGAEVGTGDLRVMDGAGAWASFTASWIDGGTLPVEVTTIDEAIPAAVPVSFVKIDVEGYELQVLAGGRRTLELHRPILYVEVNHLILVDAGSSGAEFLERVRDEYGYEVVPEHAHMLAEARSGLANLLMHHPTRA
jgi:FkbM family methyltransferase